MYKLINSNKFYNMKATVETVRFDDGMIVRRLVSYESVVCDVCLETGTIFLYPRYQYSPTTIRQVTRFLDEYVPLSFGWWCIALIRELHEKTDRHGYRILDNYGIFFLDHVLGTNNRW